VPTVKPIVRYMLPCQDWQLDEASGKVTIVGLLTNIRAVEEPAYPLLYQELCVFLALTGGRGQGEGKIVCAVEETGQVVFETRPRPMTFGPDPLAVVGVAFRIRDCPFPSPGLYSIQFWYDGTLVEERPLLLR
jgi:hypothetical protein